MTDIVERLSVAWEKQPGAAMTKINRILIERRDAIAEITRLRQLLSEAEKRLERAWVIPGPGNEYRMLTRPPAGDEAPSVAIVYRALQSEER